MKIFILICTFLVAQSAWGLALNFDDKQNESKLTDWISGFYGMKGEPNWKIEKEPSAPSKPNILKQTGRATYSWYIHKDTKIKDGSIECMFNIISGKEDPEAGLVWRHQDEKNYYYLRANSVKENIVFYRMNKGIKEQVKIADIKVSFNIWHKLRVEFKNEQIDVFFNNKPLMSMRDNVFKTEGRVGLFTTADTISAYDNIEFKSF